jgi:KUP system potassium uptake protein
VSTGTNGHGSHGSQRALILGAVGVVFGDIGTSPLYTIQECFGPHGVQASRENVLGLVSLISWALTLVVTVKYLMFVMRADNRGEGGILALFALVPEKLRSSASNAPSWIALAALLGAALLFGDGIITPAISVLSAMEGLEVATPKLQPVVVPATVFILALLFFVQRRGTATIGRFFGPVMVLWFSTLAVLGAVHLVRNPGILAALSPHHAVFFLAHHGFHGFALLGSVVLAVTGGEALYADMGHFGRGPIRFAWLGLVFPALILCYMGQGALLLSHPELAERPFFAMVPVGLPVYALVAIAAPATVIASQALISGVFSLTRQAVQLGYFPRVEIRHTSSESEGQIYVPFLNAVLAVACIGLVVIFQHSSRLAAAYGLAVTGTMAITSILFFEVMRHKWKTPIAKALPLLLLFLAIDLPFLGANMLKFFVGGYLPVAMAAVFLGVMLVWKRGRTVLSGFYAKSAVRLEDFLARLAKGSPFRDGENVMRSPGTGIFLASSPKGTPPILLHFVQRLACLPETIVLLTVITDAVPFVREDEQLEVETLGQGFYRVIAHAGFMDEPRVTALLGRAVSEKGLPIEVGKATFFVGRETFLATERGEMGVWTESTYSFLSRNARSASLYFGIPPEQVVEVGLQVDL